MQVSVEQLDGLERRMTVQVPADEIDKKVKDRLQSLSREVKLDGFRPGKVPFNVVRRMFGPRVRQEVMNELIESSFKNALTQKNLRLVSSPQVEPKNIDKKGDLEYSAIFEVFPEFETVGLDRLKVERPIAKVTEVDIDNMLENLRRQRAIWTEVEREARLEDRLTITFEGKCEGEDFSNNKAENVPLVLGSGAMIAGFEDALVGLRAGAETELELTFPEEYHSQEIAGKRVHFVVKVDAVAESNLPEVNAEFSKEFGIEDGGVESLRKALKESMERELNEAVQNIVKQQVIQGLIDANDILVPRAMVKNEIENLVKQAGLSKADTENTEDVKSQALEKEARRRVTLGLLMSQLTSAQGIKLDNARLQAQLEAVASTYENPPAALQWYQQNPEAMEIMRALVLENQVMDWLLARAEVIDKPCSFSEVMKPKAR